MSSPQEKARRYDAKPQCKGPSNRDVKRQLEEAAKDDGFKKAQASKSD